MQISMFRRTATPRPAPQQAERPAMIDRLEGRIYFAHLGHVVTLPDAAQHGSQGLETAIDAPADHRRSRLIVSA